MSNEVHKAPRKPPKRRRRGDPAGRPFTGAQLAERAAALPVVSFPDLPVSQHRQQIAEAIRDHQVVIVSGETGSGKTTQIPKICLQLGRGIGGMIGHTQPRRLAARSVAERIADELGQTMGRAHGQVIGYQVRFTDEVGPTTLVKLMTDGILLNEIQLDPQLSRYDTIIVDEAHERSLNIDFILGYLAGLLPKRPDLKLIITSATIDSQRFADHFAGLLGQDVPVIEVSGRTYPVEVRYRPLAEDDSEPLPITGTFQQLVLEDPTGPLPTLGYGLGDEIDLEQGLCDAVDELLGEPDGDILVFLPGERDIREAKHTLEDHLADRRVLGGWEIIPLFARLSAAEQQKIFRPGSSRRIILATNIAETSLTVPRIRYVIDSGLARVSRFSNKTKVQRLPIEPVSQASANQRAGRAGRLDDGVAIRLYSAADYSRRPQFTDPEILRTSLASVILQMKALGLGEVADFPFIDPPSQRAVRDGVQLLVEIGALTESGELTSTGTQLARLPIDPRLGRMLLAGHANGCASEVVVIIAALSIQDVRERPAESQGSADQSHARFADKRSDFLTYLNLWRYLNVQSRDLSRSAFRRLCRAEHLHYLRYREWRDVVSQLRQICRQLGISVDPLGEPSKADIRRFASVADAVVTYGQSSRAVDYDQLHRSLLVGLLSNVGTWDQNKATYLGTRGTRFTIWPGSGLARAHPRWVMAAELVETSRLFARTVALIKVEWIEEVAGHLVNRTYSEPYWSRAKGAAMIKERILLYGLTLSADRPVLLASLGNRPIGAAKSTRPIVAKPGTVAAIAQGIFTERSDGGWASKFMRGAGLEPSDSLSATELARELFIREALVGGKWRFRHLKFMEHNNRLLEEARELERRSRTAGLVASDEQLFDFFDDRVPERITSARSFENWWRKTRSTEPELLNLRWEDAVREAPNHDPHDFPDYWHQGDLSFPLSYDFEPGKSDDGVTVTIPIAVLPQVKDEGFDWLVPGMLTELCVGTIRALPKNKRKGLAPAPDMGSLIARKLEHSGLERTELEHGGLLPASSATAVEERPDSSPEQVAPEDDPRSLDASLDRLQQWAARKGNLHQGSSVRAANSSETPPAVAEPPPEPFVSKRFFPAFASAVRQLRGTHLSDADEHYAAEHLPPHLQMRFRVVDERGRTLGQGHSLVALQRQLAKKADVAVSAAVKSAVRTAATAAAAPKQDRHPDEWGRGTITQFPDKPLPKVVETETPGGLLVRGYPALSPVGAGDVALRLSASRDLAERDHRLGLARLLYQRLRLPTGRITSRWSGREALLLASAPYASTEDLVADAGLAAAQALVDELGGQYVTSAADFEALVGKARDKFEEEIYRLLLITVKTLEAVSRTQEAMADNQQESTQPVREDIAADLRRLLPPNFLSMTPRRVADYLPRFVSALAIRLQRAGRDSKGLSQDRRKAAVVAEVVAAWQRRVDAAAERPFSTVAAKDIERIRWLLEELRVSQFAEQLGTSERVSPQRLVREIEAIGSK